MQSYFGYIFLPKENAFQKNEGVHLFMVEDNFWLEASINLFSVIRANLIKCKN